MSERIKDAELILIALAGLVVLAIVVEVISQSRWEAFKERHHCKEVTEVMVRGMRGYECDDGVTYWR